MFSLRIHRVFSLAPALLLAASASAGGLQTGGPVVKTQAADDQGLASGVWLAPSRDADGELRGALRTEAGEVKFLIDAQLTFERQDVRGLRRGKLMGRLLPVAQDAFAPKKKTLPITLAGRWSQGERSRGDFDAYALADLGSPFLPPIVIASVRGRLSALPHVVSSEPGSLAISKSGSRSPGLASREPRNPRSGGTGMKISPSSAGARSLAGRSVTDTNHTPDDIVCPKGFNLGTSKVANRALRSLQPDVGSDDQVIICRQGDAFHIGSKRVDGLGLRSVQIDDGSDDQVIICRQGDAFHVSSKRVDGLGLRSVQSDDDDGQVIICRQDLSEGLRARQASGRDSLSGGRGLAPRDDAAPRGVFMARWSSLL